MADKEKQFKVLVCRGPSCGDVHRSSVLRDEMERLLGLHCIDSVNMVWQSCFGRCTKGPNILVRELSTERKITSLSQSFVLATRPLAIGGRATMYNYVTLSDVNDIVCEHLKEYRPVRRLVEASKQKVLSFNADIMNEEKDGDS